MGDSKKNGLLLNELDSIDEERNEHRRIPSYRKRKERSRGFRKSGVEDEDYDEDDDDNDDDDNNNKKRSEKIDDFTDSFMKRKYSSFKSYLQSDK